MQIYRSILTSPHPHSCLLKPDIERMYMNDRARHDKIARAWTKKYAMNEPMTLQQLATETVYEHRDNLPWQKLPKKLICKIMRLKKYLDDGDKVTSKY